MIWFVIFVLWPLAELFVIVKLSEAIGFLLVLALLVISWPIGTRVIRHEGRAAWRRLQEAINAGRVPTDEVLDGALVLFGGALLLVPGFITDAIGLLLLLPPTRALARRVLARHHTNVWVNRAAGFGAGLGPNPRNSAGTNPNQYYDVDATATDIDNPELKP